MIDWGRVEELREEVGEEDFLDIAGLFLEEVDEVIKRLTDVPDPAKFEEELHFLKGSALNLGFQEFSVLCATGEKLAARGGAKSVNIAAVVTSYSASRELFITQIEPGNTA